MTVTTLSRNVATILCAASLFACASTSGGGAPPADRDVIRYEEIRATPVSDVYTLIERLRPGWLRMRGRLSITQAEDIMVYLDNSRYGGRASLRGISAASITSVRFVDARTATQRWGLNHGHGAIVVSTRPPQ